MNFKEELEQRTREAEEIIKSYLPKEEGFAKNMAEAMNYSMLSGGKRLRPVFMREVYSMFGGTGKVIEPFMAAMEMIHTHSLIHDDLRHLTMMSTEEEEKPPMLFMESQRQFLQEMHF